MRASAIEQIEASRPNHFDRRAVEQIKTRYGKSSEQPRRLVALISLGDMAAGETGVIVGLRNFF